MQRDYSEIVNLALQPNAGADGKLRYDEATQAIAGAAIAERRTASAAIAIVNRELDEIVSLSEPGLHPTLDKIRYDIVSRIEDEAGPSPRRRAMTTRLVGLGGVLAVILVVAVYFGVRQYNMIPITAPIETRAGLEQRAAALVKVIRYQQWHPGRFGDASYTRTSFIKDILLWPIQPTDEETAGARDLAGAIIGTAAQLRDLGKACNLPAFASDAMSDEDVAFLGNVAGYLRNKATKWNNPAPLTLVDAIVQGHRC